MRLQEAMAAVSSGQVVNLGSVVHAPEAGGTKIVRTPGSGTSTRPERQVSLG